MRWDEIEMEDSQLARNMISREWTSTTAAQPYELFTHIQPRFIQIPIVSVVLRGWKPHRLLIFGHDKAGRDKAKGLALAKIEERVRTLGHWVWMCSPLSLLAHKKLSTNDSQGLRNDAHGCTCNRGQKHVPWWSQIYIYIWATVKISEDQFSREGLKMTSDMHETL